MSRQYSMGKRAATQEKTRERIIQATMALHGEKGVIQTTINDIAARAGVGAATVLRHFPDTNALVSACGQQVTIEIAPPRPEDAPALFAGLSTTEERLTRLVRELHAFYERGHRVIEVAGQERAQVEGLDQFMTMLDGDRRKLLCAAMEPDKPEDRLIGALMALSGFCVWRGLRDGGFSAGEATAFHTAIMCRATTILLDGKTGQPSERLA